MGADDHDFFSISHALPGTLDVRQSMAESVCTPSVPILRLRSLVAAEGVHENLLALHDMKRTCFMHALDKVVRVRLGEHMSACTTMVQVHLIESSHFWLVREATQLRMFFQGIVFIKTGFSP
jgi:hypothetical protein